MQTGLYICVSLSYMYLYVCTCPHAMFLFTIGTFIELIFVRCFISMTILYVVTNPGKANGIVYIRVDDLQSMGQIQPTTCF